MQSLDDLLDPDLAPRAGPELDDDLLSLPETVDYNQPSNQPENAMSMTADQKLDLFLGKAATTQQGPEKLSNDSGNFRTELTNLRQETVPAIAALKAELTVTNNRIATLESRATRADTGAAPPRPPGS